VSETAHHWIPAVASPMQSRLTRTLVQTNSITRLVLQVIKKVSLSLCIIKHYAVKAYGGVQDSSVSTSHEVMS
jgi:hypothetical protein